MARGISIRVNGDYACFTRPEMKVERVSYDCMTPSAARGLLEAIYWKPSIKWVIRRIHVLNPIKFTNIRRNELGHRLPSANIKKAMKGTIDSLETFIEDDRQQRAATVLKDVSYIVEAEFAYTGDSDQNDGKHLDIFSRRASRGKCFHRPYLGCREFAADFELHEGHAPESALKGDERDLGYMLWDLDYRNPKDIRPKFFRARLVDGVMEVPAPDSAEVLS